MDRKALIEEAFKALENSYSPSSNFKVGACVLCRDGTLFYGTNIENASYPVTNCAERSALFACYSRGYREKDIEAIAIVSNGARISAPCGACRQVLCELLEPLTPIYLSNGTEEMETNIQRLLPMQFNRKDVLG